MLVSNLSAENPIFGVEIGLVTPPVGFNLFVIQGLNKRDLPYIAWAALKDKTLDD